MDDADEDIEVTFSKDGKTIFIKVTSKNSVTLPALIMLLEGYLSDLVRTQTQRERQTTNH